MNSIRATQFRQWCTCCYRILTDAGTISHEYAQAFAETEFEKYRVIQDQLYQSDFDKFELPTLPFDEKEE